VWDGEEEARVVVQEIEDLRAAGHSLDDIAVLVRASFQMREFEERLITVGLPYRVIGGPRFYERMEIRDAIAYFRVTVSPADDLAFERIVNTPKRGLGPASLQSIHLLARARGRSLHDAARALSETDELKPKARATLRGLLDDFAHWRASLDILPHEELAALILDESGYTEMWMKDKSPEAPGRLENLQELIAGLDEFENLQGFLEHVSLVMDNDDNDTDEKANLMTLHAAKGLEFDTVFLPGWEDGLFPHQRTLDDSGLNGLEEERRLAYVGLTRARQRAKISFAANRRIYNQWQNALPSRFVSELPRDHVEDLGSSGFAGGYGKDGRPTGMFEMNTMAAFGRSPRRRGHARDGTVIEGEGWEVVSSGSDPPGARFEEGTRVFHQKFGYGRVTGSDGPKLEIAFEKSGTKKVLDSFVEKA
jgi:DNA helicase-2/ATP-dependent DNA helicase PcrA